MTRIILAGDPQGEHLYAERRGDKIVVKSRMNRNNARGLVSLRDVLVVELTASQIRVLIREEEHEAPLPQVIIVEDYAIQPD